jgi:hypothetical protein
VSGSLTSRLQILQQLWRWIQACFSQTVEKRAAKIWMRRDDGVEGVEDD